MLNVLTPQTLYCQDGIKNKYIEALSNCDYSYTLLEKQTRQLEFEIKALKIDLSVCNTSDSTKSEAIKRLIYEKSLYLDKIDLHKENEKGLNLKINSLEKRNKNKWLFAITGIIIGIFINKL
jgi:hypothetical protein